MQEFGGQRYITFDGTDGKSEVETLGKTDIKLAVHKSWCLDFRIKKIRFPLAKSDVWLAKYSVTIKYKAFINYSLLKVQLKKADIKSHAQRSFYTSKWRS